MPIRWYLWGICQLVALACLTIFYQLSTSKRTADMDLLSALSSEDKGNVVTPRSPPPAQTGISNALLQRPQRARRRCKSIRKVRPSLTEGIADVPCKVRFLSAALKVFAEACNTCCQAGLTSGGEDKEPQWKCVCLNVIRVRRSVRKACIAESLGGIVFFNVKLASSAVVKTLTLEILEQSCSITTSETYSLVSA